MRILVDQDEVLAQMVKKVLHRWNEENGTSFSRDHINAWHMEDVLGRHRDGTPADIIVDRWLAEPGFFVDLEPIDGAVDGLNRLIDSKHDVVIVTSVPERYSNAFDGKRIWMKRYFPNFSMKNFIACSRKDLVTADILIDDGSHNIGDWVQAHKEGAILFDAPWNQWVGETHNGVLVRRAFDWPHIIHTVEEIASQKHDLLSSAVAVSFE